MNNKVKCVVLLLILTSIIFGSINIRGVSEIPRFELPLLITCTGQTLDYLTVYNLTRKLNIEAVNDPLTPFTPRKMQEQGYQTMIVVMGVSPKGLGAARLNQEDELERCKLVFEKARELQIKIIGAHIGGEAVRNAIADKFITTFAPQCDYLMVLAKGNKDGLFNRIAEENKIPLNVFQTFAELPAIITAMFK